MATIEVNAEELSKNASSLLSLIDETLDAETYALTTEKTFSTSFSSYISDMIGLYMQINDALTDVGKGKDPDSLFSSLNRFVDAFTGGIAVTDDPKEREVFNDHLDMMNNTINKYFPSALHR